MSTLTTPVTPLPHVQVAVQLFRERLLPAKIKEDNGVFGGWFASKRLNAGNMTAGAIADAMYDAVVADCERTPKDRQIVWLVPPKMLQREIDQQKNRPTNVQDVREAATFEAKVRESEKKDADAKTQAKAKKQAIELIERFCPTRRGRLVHEVPVGGKTQSVDDLRATWTKWANEKDAIAALEAIKTQQNSIYAYLEREESRSK